MFVNDLDETGRGESVRWAAMDLDVLDETELCCDVSVMFFVVSARHYFTIYYIDTAVYRKLHSS
jgi:hypothetical protein